MAKEYVKLWDSYESYFESYSAAEVGRLVLAMMKYKSQGVEPEFSGSEKFIWPAIRRDIDLDREFTEKKQSSGKSGGKQNQAKASTLKQTEANESKNKQEYRNTGIQEHRDTDIPATAAAPAQSAIYSPDLAACIQRYEQNCGSVPRAVSDAISTALLKFPASLICQAIDEAAANNARRWSYISKILDRCEQQGIYTVDAYLAEKERAKPTRPAPRQPDAAASARDKLRALAKGVTPDD